MSVPRARFTVAILLLALLGSMTSAFAAPAPAPCAVAHHDCDDVPTIAQCCCGDSRSTAPSVPPEQRVERGSITIVATPADDNAIVVAGAATGLLHVCGVSPRACLLDLSTLFATLLI